LQFLEKFTLKIMKKKHLDFLTKFHKPTSRHLYTLRDGGVNKD